MTYGRASIAAQAEYIAHVAYIDASVKFCRYCKAARTRSGDDAAECKAHQSERRLAYVTSPVSETYWAS